MPTMPATPCVARAAPRRLDTVATIEIPAGWYSPMPAPSSVSEPASSHSVGESATTSANSAALPIARVITALGP